MSIVQFDENFNNRLSNIFLERKGDLVTELLKAFDTSDFHYCRFALMDYYHLYPELSIENLKAKQRFLELRDACVFFILNYAEQLRDGYTTSHAHENVFLEDMRMLGLDTSQTQDIALKNWEEFTSSIKQQFWNDVQNLQAYRNISDLNLFDDRLPVTPREKLLSTKRVAILNGVTIELPTYNIFDIASTLEYYDRLIGFFYPEFELQKNVSNKKIKRYAKRLNDDLYLSLFIDFSFLEGELKKNDLEFPQIKIEVFSKQLTTCIKENDYLLNQQEHPIVRLSSTKSLGNFPRRLGNSSEEEDYLKRELFFNMAVHSFYLNKHLQFLSKNILCLFN